MSIFSTIIDIIFMISIILVDVTIFFKEVEKPRAYRSKLILALATISFMIIVIYAIAFVIKLVTT